MLHRRSQESSHGRKWVHNTDMYSLEADLINNSIRQLTDGGDIDGITKLRLLCLSRGATGILELGRVFRNTDNDDSKTLYEGEFIGGIRRMGFDITDEEIGGMFRSFAHKDNSYVDMSEFMHKLRPPMSQSRLNIIDMAFDKIDKGGHGVVSLQDLKSVYSVKEHPKYHSGELSKDEMQTEFMHNFEGGSGDLQGKVSKEEFLNYYAALGASIENDTYFDLLLRRSYTL